MAAYLDQTQKIGFFYGNASTELADRLPPDQNFPDAPAELSLNQLDQKMDSIFETLDLLEQRNHELSFFVSDLAKLLK